MAQSRPRWNTGHDRDDVKAEFERREASDPMFRDRYGAMAHWMRVQALNEWNGQKSDTNANSDMVRAHENLTHLRPNGDQAMADRHSEMNTMPGTSRANKRLETNGGESCKPSASKIPAAAPGIATVPPQSTISSKLSITKQPHGNGKISGSNSSVTVPVTTPSHPKERSLPQLGQSDIGPAIHTTGKSASSRPAPSSSRKTSNGSPTPPNSKSSKPSSNFSGTTLSSKPKDSSSSPAPPISTLSGRSSATLSRNPANGGKLPSSQTGLTTSAQEISHTHNECLSTDQPEIPLTCGTDLIEKFDTSEEVQDYLIRCTRLKIDESMTLKSLRDALKIAENLNVENIYQLSEEAEVCDNWG